MLSTPARDDLAGLADGEEPRGEVGRVTDRRVVHAEVATDGPDDDGPSVDPHPHAELDPVGTLGLFGQRLEVGLDPERRAQRALSVVFMRDRRPKERHHAVTEELVDCALVTVNRFQDDLEGAVHDCVDVLGIERLGHRRKSRHVREHHGDDLPLALDGALGGEDLLGKVPRCVDLRGCEAGGRRHRSRRGDRGRRRRSTRQPLAALATEFVAGRVGGLTSGTERLESRPALPAELGPWGIGVPALGTLHSYDSTASTLTDAP